MIVRFETEFISFLIYSHKSTSFTVLAQNMCFEEYIKQNAVTKIQNLAFLMGYQAKVRQEIHGFLLSDHNPFHQFPLLGSVELVGFGRLEYKGPKTVYAAKIILR